MSQNPSDFKIKTYGIPSFKVNYTALNDINTYTSADFCVPVIQEWTYDRAPSASNASISDNGLRISNMSANFTELNQFINYYFAIKNEGNYDAYLDLERYFKIYDEEEKLKIVCTAKEGTSQNLVDEACTDIQYYITLYDSENNSIITENDYYVLPAGDYIFLEIQLDSSNHSSYSKATLADGDFDVEFEDFTFEFSTTEPKQ